uniref:7TM_GPCR_Srx domain-containing protein n=1 Tax=Globodera pallida TaxID=36090 RepID=A0A183CKE0_GLOPA
MRIYSKILLQTCFTDLLLVIMTLLFHHYSLTSQKGEQEIIPDGLFTINGTESIWWRLLGSACWFYLIYVTLFGFLAQFIYRYLALNWNKKLSPFKYFLLFGVIQLFPMAYCAIFYWRLYPSDGHYLLEDQSIADILGLNLTEANVVIIGYGYHDNFMILTLYYIIILCSIAYAIIFTLAYLMHKFLRERSKLGASSVLTDKMIEMNKQISRNLIIQASLPLIVWVSLVFLQYNSNNDNPNLKLNTLRARHVDV